MKTRTVYVLIVVVLLVVFAVFIAKKLVNKPTTEVISSSDENNGSVSSSVFPLQKGSRGTEVKHLQRYLNVNKPAGLFQNLTIDGIFGDKTLNLCLTVLKVSSVSESLYNSKGIKYYQI